MYKWNDGTDYLMHHGIKGQKWGVRNYQYEDGSLTPEGKIRYRNSDGTLTDVGRAKLKTTKQSLTRKAVGSALSSAGIGAARSAFKSLAAPEILTSTWSVGVNGLGTIGGGTTTTVIREGVKWAATALKIANPTLAVALGATVAIAAGAAFVASRLKDDERLRKNLESEKNNG